MHWWWASAGFSLQVRQHLCMCWQHETRHSTPCSVQQASFLPRWLAGGSGVIVLCRPQISLPTSAWHGI